MRLTTIREYGHKLPVGILKEGSLHKQFSFRPHTAKTDRLLNVWREANKGKHLGWEVCKYLSLVVSSLGSEAIPLDATGNSTDDTLTRFLPLSFGDVMYLWVCARMAAVKEKCEIRYACPACGSQATVIVDLQDTEVMVLEDPKEYLAKIELAQGFTLLSGSPAKVISLRPAPFSAFLLPGSTSENTDGLGYSQLRECVSSIQGAQDGYVLTDEEIDTLPRLDWLRLDRLANRVTGGPRLRTEIVCKALRKDTGQACSHVITHALDWSYDSFFDSSVPPGAFLI